MSSSVELLDSLGQVCRRSCRHGTAGESWRYWEYDIKGRRVLESYPSRMPSSLAPGSGFDWKPDPSSCLRSVCDPLGRVTHQIRPAHGGDNHFIVSERVYLNGGATIQERRLRLQNYKQPISAGVLLASNERQLLYIAGEERVCSKLDASGLQSFFLYDAHGRLVQGRDPSGKVELRTYNQDDQILTTVMFIKIPTLRKVH